MERVGGIVRKCPIKIPNFICECMKVMERLTVGIKEYGSAYTGQ